MKLEDQVCSLELAKKLKELGVKQESLWYWELIKKGIEFDGRKSDKDKITIVRREVFKDKYVEYFSAFTVAELGEMLKPQGHQLPVWSKKYGVFHSDCGGFFGSVWIQDKIESNARAKMLIHLIEKEIVKP